MSVASCVSHASETEPVAPGGTSEGVWCVGACGGIDPLTPTWASPGRAPARVDIDPGGFQSRHLSPCRAAHQASLTAGDRPRPSLPSHLLSPGQHPLLVRSSARLCLGRPSSGDSVRETALRPRPQELCLCLALGILASVFTWGLQCQALSPQPASCLRESSILSGAHSALPCPVAERS